jgi:oxygen-independent coproporphyrinogen-3 oxidase
MDAFVEALCAEARTRQSEVGETVMTVYFGGGTPSRLRQEHFDRIFDTLHSLFTIDPAAEITLEANPDDLSESYVRMLSRLPVNRLSVGVQSFDDGELVFLHRRHSSRQAEDAVKRCREYGFDNISIDLMYGLPPQTEASWQRSLSRAVALDPQHISAYHLIYEEKTRMYRLLQAGKIAATDENVSLAMFARLIDCLTAHGYVHYEISAFGKEGCFSRHNSAYWKNTKYLGLGPSAHSFDGNSRSFNVASLTRYIDGRPPLRETEHLSAGEKYNEAVLTGLRTVWGIDLADIKVHFGDELHRYCLRNARKYLDRRLLETDNNSLKLTRDGLFISDSIMSDLMWVADRR